MMLSHIFTHDIEPGMLFNIPDHPVNVMLDITNDCNNRCIYCYNPDSSINHGRSSDPKILKKIVSILGLSGTKEILYLGGEPFSSPSFMEILEVGRKYNIFQRTVSNGSFLIDKNVCGVFKEKGLDEVGISFHSSDEAVHDRITNRKGSFQEAVLSLQNCILAGISSFIQYSPNRFNSSRDILKLAEYIKILFGDEVKCFDINRLLPIGRGQKAQSVFLENDEWFEFLVQSSNLRRYGFDVHAELTPFCWINHKAKENNIPDHTLNEVYKMNRGCYMWVAQLALDYNGRIKFCPAGPAVGPSIIDVKWPSFWKTGEEFKRYRSFSWNGKCVDFDKKNACAFFYRCLGGCKYSKGTPYQIDHYTIGPQNNLNEGYKNGKISKDKQSYNSEGVAWCR